MILYDSNETLVDLVDNETERNQKIIARSVCEAISESGIPYSKYCRNMTEMGVKNPKIRCLKGE